LTWLMSVWGSGGCRDQLQTASRFTKWDVIV
jgi:hypothetical protein